MNKITKIAFAGAPCSGKSSTLKSISKLPYNSKYKIIFLSEIATAFLEDAPPFIKESTNQIVFQYYIYRTQCFVERQIQQMLFDEQRKVILITDRGICDIFAYLSKDEYKKILNPTDFETFDSNYDCVLYFETSDENRNRFNATNRIENNFNEIRELNEKTRGAWEKYYPNKLQTIPYANSFEDKIYNTIKLINKIMNDEIYILDSKD